jgi:hypothetical protein
MTSASRPRASPRLRQRHAEAAADHRVESGIDGPPCLGFDLVEPEAENRFGLAGLGLRLHRCQVSSFWPYSAVRAVRADGADGAVGAFRAVPAIHAC